MVERGQDFITLRNVDRSGPVPRTNTFTLLENGLHYFEGGEWRLSEDMIESFADGAVARRGPHRAVFGHDLNGQSAFDLEGPGGRLRGGVRSLHLTDAAAGRSVLLARVRPQAPAELHPPNRIVYRDAFEGAVRADVVLIWRHNYVAQEVVLRSRAALPEGFAPDTTQLEIVTEFIDPPQAQVSERRAQRPGGGERADHSLIRFGGWTILPGRALAIDEGGGVSLGGASPRAEGALIGKRWERMADGRTLLIESLEWEVLHDQSRDLPLAAVEAEASDEPAWKEPPERAFVRSPEAQPVRLASAPYEAKGVALDFVVIPDQGTPTTFLAGQTYAVRTWYYVGGAATFQAGCVIKNHSTSSLVLYGTSINFPATGAPCVFTSIDDDLFGEKITATQYLPGSDGNPENSEPNLRIDDALRIWDVNYSTLVQNALFRWGASGIEYFRTGPAANHTISNCRFEHITFSGLNSALQVSIDPSRTVTLQNSKKCNVDNDYSVYQGGGVDGSLLTDCQVSNATMLSGQEVEPAIVVRQISPTQTRIVIVSFLTGRTDPDVLIRSISNDGGVTWVKTPIADGVFLEADGQTPMIRGDRDPTMAYDDFGNLFLAYNGYIGTAYVVPLYVSTDHGQSFSRVGSFTIFDGRRDLPRLATGPSGVIGSSSVWISYWGGPAEGGEGRIRGARVNGLGAVESTYIDRILPNGRDCKLTSAAVGPNGQLVASYANLTQPYSGHNGAPPKPLRTALDPDGLGPLDFVPQASFDLAFGWESIKATAGDLEILPIPTLAWDRPRNRLYLVYHSRPAPCPLPDSTITWPINYDPDDEPCRSDTDIYLKVGTVSGSVITWSDRVRVNDDPVDSRASQFHPRVAIDEDSGKVAVTWYDARLAPNNDRVHIFAAISLNAFATVPRNIQVNHEGSNGIVNGWFWDYTGLAYVKGVIYPAWQDNSNNPAGNPDGNHSKNDLYVGQIRYY